MKESPKARRLKRHHQRGKRQGALNLVSLMDIFTILVFFLMVNSSSDVQILSENDGIELPESSAEQPPGDILALTVTAEDVLVNGRAVLKRAALQALEGEIAPDLKAELDYQASRALAGPSDDGRPIAIVADRQLPYGLLKKLMATCVEAGYTRISLAVRPQGGQEA